MVVARTGPAATSSPGASTRSGTPRGGPRRTGCKPTTRGRFRRLRGGRSGRSRQEPLPAGVRPADQHGGLGDVLADPVEDAGERLGLPGLGGELLSGGHQFAGGLADDLDGIDLGVGWAGLRAGRIVHSRTSFPVSPRVAVLTHRPGALYVLGCSRYAHRSDTYRRVALESASVLVSYLDRHGCAGDRLPRGAAAAPAD